MTHTNAITGSSAACAVSMSSSPAVPRQRARNNLGHRCDPSLEGSGGASGTYSLLATTALFVAAVVAARVAVEHTTGWDGESPVKDMSLVFTGLFFVLGRMFSTVNSDIKEALRMPMDVCCALDLIEDYFRFAAAKILCAEEGAATAGGSGISMTYDAASMTLLAVDGVTVVGSAEEEAEEVMVQTEERGIQSVERDSAVTGTCTCGAEITEANPTTISTPTPSAIPPMELYKHQRHAASTAGPFSPDATGAGIGNAEPLASGAEQPCERCGHPKGRRGTLAIVNTNATTVATCHRSTNSRNSRGGGGRPLLPAVRTVTIGPARGTAQLVTARRLLVAVAKSFHDSLVGSEERVAAFLAEERAAKRRERDSTATAGDASLSIAPRTTNGSQILPASAVEPSPSADEGALLRTATPSTSSSSEVYSRQPSTAPHGGSYLRRRKGSTDSTSTKGGGSRKGRTSRKSDSPTAEWLPIGLYGFDNGPQPTAFSECLNLLERINHLTNVWGGDREKIVVRVPRFLDTIRRTAGRAAVIKRTDVLPAAMALVNYFVVMSGVLMVLATYKTYASLTVGMGCTMVVSLFMARLLAAMDDPFGCDVGSSADDSFFASFWARWVRGHSTGAEMFPLVEYVRRTERLIAADEALERLREEARAVWRQRQAPPTDG